MRTSSGFQPGTLEPRSFCPICLTNASEAVNQIMQPYVKHEIERELERRGMTESVWVYVRVRERERLKNVVYHSGT